MVEILSPRDKTWEKLAFYGAHKVDQLLIVDLQKRRVDWLGLDPSDGYRALARSGLMELGPAELAERLDWPPASSTEIGGGGFERAADVSRSLLPDAGVTQHHIASEGAP